MATKVMRSMLEVCKSITYTDAGVKIISAVNAENIKEIESLAKELCEKDA